MVIAGSVLLAGCWQTKVDFYGQDTPLTPFKPGPMTTTDADGHVTPTHLALDHGVYYLAMSENSAFRLRFFPLANVPTDNFIAEMELVKNCKMGVCDPPETTAPHYFGLVHLTRSGGAEELAGNCDGNAAQVLGAKRVGLTCEFSDRAKLEQALRTLVGTKPVATVNPQ